MGTFHSSKGELHGITVLVETHSDAVYVGRCDTVAPHGVVLLDADRFEGVGDERMAWLKNAKQFGIWPKIPHVVVPTEDVKQITRLGELAL